MVMLGPITSSVHWNKALKLSPIKNWTQKSYWYWAYIFLEPSFQPNLQPLTFRFRVCNLSQRSYKYAPQELNYTMKPTSSLQSSSPPPEFPLSSCFTHGLIHTYEHVCVRFMLLRFSFCCLRFEVGLHSTIK